MHSTILRNPARAMLSLSVFVTLSIVASNATAESAPMDAGSLCSAALLPDTMHTVPANFPAAILWPEGSPVTAGTVTMFGAPARITSETRFGREYWLATPTVSSTVGVQSIVPAFNCPPGVYRDAGAHGSDMPRTFTTSAAIPFPTTAGTLFFKDVPDQSRLPVRLQYSEGFAPFSPFAGADVTIGEQTFSIPYGRLAGTMYEWDAVKNEGCPSTATSTVMSIAVHIAGMSAAQDPAIVTATLPLSCAVISNYPYPRYGDAGGPRPIEDGGHTSPYWDAGAPDPVKDSGATPVTQPGGSSSCHFSPRGDGFGSASLLGLALCVAACRGRRRTEHGKGEA